ncbi:acyloxyacyl hydrolase [uncultured Hymenobacter sp.]|uniref:acyloxyacyl hydrolase n=1 Tax=uncultured Hymenobacter sp. TaxID=170016 RepID=UPI0035CB9C61
MTFPLLPDFLSFLRMCGAACLPPLLAATPVAAQVPVRADSLPGGLAPPAPLIIGAYAQGSFLLDHTYAVQHLVRAHPTGFELNVQRQTTGRQPWHGWYKFPKVGLALVYYNYHNPTLGRSYAASLYLSKSFWRTDRHDLSFRLGTGLAYLTNPYDQQTNHKNTIASSALNATLQLRLEYDQALTERLGLLLGLGLNHYSNGATTKPNFGANLPTLVLGLNYHQRRPAPLGAAPAPAPADVGHYFFNLSTSLGFKQRNESDQTKYAVNSVTAAAGRRLNRKSNLVLGLEGFYDRSLQATLRDTAQDRRQLPDVRKAGAFLGHELLFGRLAFVSHLGFYLYNPYKSNKFYYERLGLKYHFTSRLFGSVDLKVHRGAADVIEFRAGVKW